MTLIAIMVVFWVVVLAIVAFFLVRELRRKKAHHIDFDRMRHGAVQQSDQRASTFGPNNTSQIGFGG